MLLSFKIIFAKNFCYNLFNLWDSDKNEINIQKHKISFYIAAAVFDDMQRLEFYDTTHSDEEDRYITIGLVRDVLTVVYCDRGEDTRIISARRATKFEIATYNNTLGRY